MSPVEGRQVNVVAVIGKRRDEVLRHRRRRVSRPRHRRETRKKRFRFAELEEGEADWDKLQRWFARLTERDFFGAEGRAGAEAALARGRGLLDEFTKEVYRAEGLESDPARDPTKG